jgi:hypothetical protein
VKLRIQATPLRQLRGGQQDQRSPTRRDPFQFRPPSRLVRNEAASSSGVDILRGHMAGRPFLKNVSHSTCGGVVRGIGAPKRLEVRAGVS